MKNRPVIQWQAVAKHIKFEPTPKQGYILRRLKRFSTIVGGKRVGKTMLAAFLALYELMQASRTIWIVAPTYDLGTRAFKEILFWRNRYLADILKINVQAKEIINQFSGSVLKLKSAEVPESLKGEGLDLVIGDEVGDWKKGIWDRYIEPNLTQTRDYGQKGRAFLIGNANYFGSDWHKMYTTPGDDKFSYHLPTAYFDSRGRIKSNNPTIVSAGELDRLYKEKDSKIWRQEYLADFVPSQGVVFSNIMECATGIFEEPRSDRYYYIGLDLGRLQDFTVITVVDSRTFSVVYCERFNQIEYSFQKKRILEVVRRYGKSNTKTLVDQTGVGQPIVDDLAREGINIEGFTLTNISKKDLIENLSIFMQQQIVSYPAALSELISELQVFSYKMSETNKIQYGAPTGYHDDHVISLALAFWELRDRRPERARDPTMSQQDLLHLSSKTDINQMVSLEENYRPIIPRSYL